jgi:hypothetical protein
MASEALRREAWAFHDVAPDHYGIAWRLEIECEFDDSIPHWLELGVAEQDLLYECFRCARRFLKSPVQVLDQLPHQLWKLPPDELHRDISMLQSLSILKIDWQRGKTAIVAELEKWVESKLEQMSQNGEESYASRGGRNDQWRAWLWDLAAHRARVCGLSREDALREMGALFGDSEKKNWEGNPSAWTDAHRATEKRLSEVEPLARLHILKGHFIGRKVVHFIPGFFEEDPVWAGDALRYFEGNNDPVFGNPVGDPGDLARGMPVISRRLRKNKRPPDQV